MTRDYKNIEAFKKADALVINVYTLTKNFPKEELYGLKSQIRRSVVSVTTNIVEGASRQHKRDYLHFLYIARGSLAEAGYLIYLSNRLGYLTNGDYKKVEAMKEESAKVLFVLIRSVEKETKMLSRVIAFLTSTIALYSFKMSI